MNHRARFLFLVLPLVGALGVQAWLGSDRNLLDRGRVLLLIALVLFAAARFRPRAGGAIVRTALSAACALAFAFAVLEVAVSTAAVHARGLLWTGVLLCMHFTALTFVLSPARERTRSERVVTGVGVLLSTLALSIALLETLFAWRAPANLYELQPDDPANGPGMHVEGNRLVGTSNFRGRWMHPEFAGVRVELNALGLRDDADETGKPPQGTASVVVLGDSFAFGCGVEMKDSFQERLETQAPESLGRPLRAACIAIPGNAQFDELEDLPGAITRFSPEVVVVAFCCTNDVEDNMRHEARALSAKVPVAEPGEGAVVGGPSSAAPREASAARLLTAARRAQFWLGSSALAQFAWPAVEPWFVRMGWADPFVASNFGLTFCMQKELPPLWAAGRVVTIGAIEKMRDLTRARGAAFVVLVIPAAIQASAARYADFVAARPEAERARYDRTAFVRALVADLRARDIAVVDPLDRLEAEEAAGRACYFREGHWNAHGHAIGAELLLPAIKDALATRPR